MPTYTYKCKDCKWYKAYLTRSLEDCMHPDNVKIMFMPVYGNVKCLKEYRKYTDWNETGDCIRFKRKWYKFWIKEK